MFDSFLVTATFFYFLAWYFFVPIATAGEIVDRNENIDNKNLLPKAEKEENVWIYALHQIELNCNEARSSTLCVAQT